MWLMQEFKENEQSNTGLVWADEKKQKNLISAKIT